MHGMTCSHCGKNTIHNFPPWLETACAVEDTACFERNRPRHSQSSPGSLAEQPSIATRMPPPPGRNW